MGDNIVPLYILSMKWSKKNLVCVCVCVFEREREGGREGNEGVGGDVPMALFLAQISVRKSFTLALNRLGQKTKMGH